MADAIAFLLFLCIFGFMGVVIYKYRHSIAKWTKDPVAGHGWSSSRKTDLERRIEDAHDELEWIEKTKAETGD